MSQHSLEEFGAYRKSMELFDLVAADMTKLKGIRCAIAWLASRWVVRIPFAQILKKGMGV